MCIYYPHRGGLHFNGKEHIIPAGLGGIQKLANGLVSDEFNADISKLEQEFLRKSILTLPRTLLGPGKRGSLSDSKATKSNIHLITDRENDIMYAVGYTQLAKVYEIPNLKLDIEQGIAQLSFDKMVSGEAYKEAVDDFLNCCVESDNLKIKEVLTDDLPPHILIIGLMNGVEENYNCFVFCNSAKSGHLTKEKIKLIGQTVSFNDSSPQSKDYMPTAHDSANFTDDYFRIYGKIAFNFLAFKKGKDWVLNSCFDNFRKWIASGGQNQYASIIDHNFGINKTLIKPPEDAHLILIIKTGTKLIAQVILYDHFGVELLLSDNFTCLFITDGLICDWKNRKEYGLSALRK